MDEVVVKQMGNMFFNSEEIQKMKLLSIVLACGKTGEDLFCHSFPCVKCLVNIDKYRTNMQARNLAKLAI